VLGQDGKLVAAQPRQHIGRAHMLLDAARDLQQELIARAVP